MSQWENETVSLTKDQLWHFGYWGALGLGAFLVLVSVVAGGERVLYLPAIGCFLGIVSRILQAEYHHKRSQ